MSNNNVRAVLGPTNTGKTYFAIERMLAHSSGIMCFPLRLLARENYDKISKIVNKDKVALITGEEKIVPKNATYYCCTVEAMPIEKRVEFIGIDEVQIAGDYERGYIFTDRILNARGTKETIFLGADTITSKLRALVPKVKIEGRPRMSALNYIGRKKVTRLKKRTAIVAFSAADVYTIADIIRKQLGGAAIVMGALSPRTRNSQVEMYENGDVDYLVATDAIGMGLNLDINHVAFSSLTKFDGRRMRYLMPNELAQIAGRAGRHLNSGTFGVTGDAPQLDQEVVDVCRKHLDNIGVSVPSGFRNESVSVIIVTTSGDDEEWRKADVKYQIFDGPLLSGDFESRQVQIKQIIDNSCKQTKGKCPLIYTNQKKVKNEEEVKPN